MIDHLESIGVMFNIISKAEAKKTLRETNYYYKLTSYKKNFKKDVHTGKYIGLEFAALTDCASIDMQLRYYLLELCLDIEHSIKTTLLDLINHNVNEDGYSIVDEFKRSFGGSYNNIIRTFSKSIYLEEMYLKRNKQIPIWVLTEIMSFGSLNLLVDMYYKKYTNVRLKRAFNLMKYARHTRNSCAHSNVILLNIKGKKNRIKNNPTPTVITIASKMKIPQNDITYKKIHDMVCLFDLHKYYCSNAANQKIKEKGFRLIERWNRNPELYRECPTLVQMKNNFIKMVNHL